MARGSNPGGGEIFSSCQNWPWRPPSLLCNGYQVSFPRAKQPGHGVNHPQYLLSTKVTERVELYLYYSDPSWSVAGKTLSLPLQAILLTVNEVYIWLMKLFLCICTTLLWCSEGVEVTLLTLKPGGVVHYIHTPAINHWTWWKEKDLILLIGNKTPVTWFKPITSLTVLS